MSLVHSSFGWRNLATNCYPLRSSQGVGAEWHDGAHRARNFVPPPFLRLAVLLAAWTTLTQVARPDSGILNASWPYQY